MVLSRFFGGRRKLRPYAQFYEDAPKLEFSGADDRALGEDALAYHRKQPPGKMSMTPTKPLDTQRDLSLAYSPGVAAVSRAIEQDPGAAASFTSRSNLVAVITNGTAVLGLGDIGPLASKPVMEGKAALFKRFAGIDAVDLEINETDPEKLAELIIKLEPSFGGINLEDIKAPDCFLVEEICRREMNIPVFHDDQHGTAVCIAAALENALHLTDRRLSDVKLVCSGAGAAAIATLNLLFGMGLSRENVIVLDQAGVIYKGRRERMTAAKEGVAVRTKARTLRQALKGADVFLGLSQGGLLDPEWIKPMTKRPIILALANPDPEVWPDHALAVAPDAIVGTGRSDLPNQVNNVLCFPYMFRGAFDAGARAITRPMMIAAAKAIAQVARMEASEETAAAYGGAVHSFGPASIMPQVFDPRLGDIVPKAIAEAAAQAQDD